MFCVSELNWNKNHAGEKAVCHLRAGDGNSELTGLAGTEVKYIVIK